VLTSELDYELPPDAIAQTPMEPRDAARLLVDRGPTIAPQHRHVSDLADLLDPGDLLVLNDTRVIPARLHLHKRTGGAVEVLLLERRPDGTWEALVKPSKRVAHGTRLTIDRQPGATVEVMGILSEGRRLVRLEGIDDEHLDEVGEVPLPPYIHEALVDPERYQTVYADRPGSVAAPTAGLHLTDALLDRCRAKGVVVARVELVVGLGTFRPLMTDRVEDHPMHAERYRIPESAQEQIAAHHGQVVAVGTTVVRALESWAATGETEAATSLFIHGDRPFAVVDRLLTNFHVPRSSLLAMIQAFVGPRWRDLYATALTDGYRFLSFGDAMLLDRHLGRE
jgi:S-adenosylmethionine:tRNA ribosyltransferase-isomerase